MSQHVVMSIQERLAAWREAERAACEAEAAIARLGQAGADPPMRDLFIRAGKLRVMADREMAAICRAAKHDESSDPGG